MPDGRSCAKLTYPAPNPVIELNLSPLNQTQSDTRWLHCEGSPELLFTENETNVHQWTHLYNADVISMPDKWEYPWYAAWDLAFHCIPLALIDPDFAKEQLTLMLREWYMHPNGQIPAYEWALGDVNPPVHAWAAWRVYKIDKKRTGRGDREFLKRISHKLMLNFTWWVNRSAGRIPAFARKIDAVLALLAHLFFCIIRSRLLRIRDSCVEPIMTLVAASKKLIKFDTKTFLSTINGGRKIEAFAKKQTIFAQGDSSDAVFYIKKER